MPLVRAAGPSLVDVLDDLVSRFILNCPAEEKASFERIFFQVESAFWFYEDHYCEKFPNQYPTLTLKTFADKLFTHSEVFKPYKKQKEDLFQRFTNYKGRVPTCGAAILNESLTKLLLVRSYNGTTWGFPKGKINKDETEAACAVREVDEEIGLDVTNFLDETQFLEHTYGTRSTTLKLFLIMGVDEYVHLETRTKKEIGEIAWHALTDLETEVAKKNRDFWIVQQLFHRIKKWAADKRKALAGGPRKKESKKAAATQEQHMQEAPVPPESVDGVGSGVDSFMFGYETERVVVSGGGVIEGRARPGKGKKGEEGTVGRTVPLDNSQTFGAEARKTKGWSVEDMFRTNEKKFNLVSTYDFENYTTSLKGKSSVNAAAESTQAARVRRAAQPPPMQKPADEAAAEAIAAAIEQEARASKSPAFGPVPGSSSSSVKQQQQQQAANKSGNKRKDQQATPPTASTTAAAKPKAGTKKVQSAKGSTKPFIDVAAVVSAFDAELTRRGVAVPAR
mmetsp:Transcript_15236/g.37169  ORF Transcript_15236/g.37169 Transcript_15236/m.37169 type:complete len:507 (+) Transcript_15236:49-1569(+)